MQTFRVAFLGAGRIGQMHLTNLNTIPGVTVQVVADTNADMAARGAAIVNAPATPATSWWLLPPTMSTP